MRYIYSDFPNQYLVIISHLNSRKLFQHINSSFFSKKFLYEMQIRIFISFIKKNSVKHCYLTKLDFF